MNTVCSQQQIAFRGNILVYTFHMNCGGGGEFALQEILSIVIVLNKLIFINNFTPFPILVFVSCAECEYSNEEGNGGSNGVVHGAAAVAWQR